MEEDIIIFHKTLLCPMISSWITIPASVWFIVALYFVFGIPEILIYIMGIIFGISFPSTAILLTISYNTNKKKYYDCAYYISIIYVGLSVVFFFGYFIGGLIYIISKLPEIEIFNILLNTFILYIPFGLLFSMLLNIISFKKKYYRNLPTLSDSQIKNNKVEIQTNLSFDEKKVDN